MTNLMMLVVMLACARVEGNPSGKPTDGGYTLGHLCISRGAVADVNRHYGTRYTFADVRDKRKAADLFVKYATMWGARTPEQIARIHNGGPRGMVKRRTREYWSRVAQQLTGPLREPFLRACAVEAMEGR